MKMQVFRGLCVLLLGCLLIDPASAERLALSEDTLYQSNAGYTLVLPKGWIRGTADDGYQKRPEVTERYGKFKNFPLGGAELFAFDYAGYEQIPNVNVRVQDDRFEANDRNRTDLEAKLRELLDGTGLRLVSMRSSIVDSSVGPSILVSARYKTGNKDLFQRQYVINGEGKSYILTFTGYAGDQDKTQPVFDAMFESFKLPGYTPPENADSIGPGLSSTAIAIACVAGVVLVGGLGGLTLLSMKNKSRRKADRLARLERARDGG